MFKKAIKWTLITGTGVIVAGALLGPDRVGDLAATAHEHVVSNVDEMINEQVRLRNEIRKLEREYPKQIAELRTQQRDIEVALIDVEQEIALGRQVMELASADLEELAPKVAAVALSDEPMARVLSERTERIQRTHAAYQTRYERGVAERELLLVEKQRIEAELVSLENESAEFQAQLAMLEREIESLQRNEALIEIAEQRRLSEERRLDRRNSGALERLQQNIAERRTEQAERMRMLQEVDTSREYEVRARSVLMAPDSDTSF